MAFQTHPYLAIDNRKTRKAIESGKQAFESDHFGRKPSFSFLPSPDFRDAWRSAHNDVLLARKVEEYCEKLRAHRWRRFSLLKLLHE
jgi:hypothetical protein